MPTTVEKYAKEILGGSWYGVKIPPWLRAFDCRSTDHHVCPKTPWGATLFADEKAAVDVGLRGVDANGERFAHDTTPLSCRTYLDARTASEQELRGQVEDMVRESKKLHQDWERARDLPSGQGGCGVYRPVAICLSNYGWGILSDKRTSRILPFGVG